MNTTDKNSGREDEPRNLNENETGFKHPGKTLTAKDKVSIKESGLGRDQGQTPADEHIELSLTQIDKGTINLHQNKNSEEKTGKEGIYNEINDDDNRDHGDSTTDWDAENSKTGRNK